METAQVGRHLHVAVPPSSVDAAVVAAAAPGAAESLWSRGGLA